MQYLFTKKDFIKRARKNYLFLLPKKSITFSTKGSGMSFWGSWLLTVCDNDLTINLSNHWLFPSEMRECILLAEKLGVTVI